MLEKITNRYAAGEQLAEQVKEAEALIEKYGWQDLKISPWGFAEPITKYIGWLKDYSACSSGTKDMLISLWNGMADILNAWEEHEKAATVRCRLLRGDHKGEERMYEPRIAELLQEDGAVEIL